MIREYEKILEVKTKKLLVELAAGRKALPGAR